MPQNFCSISQKGLITLTFHPSFRNLILEQAISYYLIIKVFAHLGYSDHDVVSSLSCIIAISKLFYFQGTVAAGRGVEPLTKESKSPTLPLRQPAINTRRIKEKTVYQTVALTIPPKANGLLQDLNLYLLNRRIAVCVFKRLLYILITLATISLPDKS